MAAPKTLAESWRNGLQQALQSLRARQGRRRWLDLAQLRIFKFLLRTYGDSTQDRYAAKLPNNVLFDQSERGCGRPARTAAQRWCR